MTVGAYAIKLLTDMQYFGTTLPRIPVPIERKMKVLLLLLTEKQKRRKSNMKAHEQGLFTKGTKVRAIYSDEENEPAWYEALVESCDDSESYKYWVIFPEYGNQSCVDLGEMELLDRRGDDRKRDHRRRSRSRSRDRRRSRSRSRDRRRSRSRDRVAGGSEDLLQKVLQEERNSSAAVGKDYGRRPASYKGSLALKQDRFTARRRSRSRSPAFRGGRDKDSKDKDSGRDRHGGGGFQGSSSSSATLSLSKAPELSQARMESLKRLKERYGDVGSSN